MFYDLDTHDETHSAENPSPGCGACEYDFTPVGQRNLIMGKRLYGSEQIPEFPMDGNTSLICWWAQKYQALDHSDCAGLTFNAWDSREFMCDWSCHEKAHGGD